MGMNITPQDRADYVKAHPEATELTEQELDAKIVAEKQKAGEEMQEGLSSKEESFIDETAAWIKENPAETALIGVGTVALGILGKKAGVFAKAGKFLTGLFQRHPKTVRVAAVGALAVGATSCNIKQETNVLVQSVTKDDITAAVKAALTDPSVREVLREEIKKAVKEGVTEALKESGMPQNIENILTQLNLIYGLTEDNTASLRAIIEILEEFGFQIDEITSYLVQQGVQMDLIVDLLVQNNNKQDQILNGIMGNNDELKDIKNQLTQILGAVNAGNQLTADNKALLSAILSTLAQVKDGQKVNTQILLKILAALKTVIGKQDENTKMMQEGLTAILTAIQNLDQNNTEKQNEIIALLDKIIAGDETIIELLKTHSNKINEIINILVKHSDKTDEIINLIKKYGDSILVALGKCGNKMDNIINLLNKYGTRVLEILNAHSKQMDVLINLINNSGKSLDEIKALLEAINNNTVSNGQKLDVIIANMKQYKTEILKAIQELQGSVNDVYVTVGNFKGSISAYYQLVLNKLEVIINQADGGNCNCNLDMDKLMEKLQEILEAIKNHKCECNCNHGGSGNHEGILGDLEDILG